MEMIWRPILNCGGKYWISEFGDIVSFKRKTPKVLTPQLDKKGYPRLRLSVKFNSSKSHRVHRLVYEAFKGEILNNLVIDHVDMEKTNNHFTNLEAVIDSENRRRYLVSGVKRGGCKGFDHPEAKLTYEQVLEIKTRKKAGEFTKDMVNDYPVSKSAIDKANRGETYRNVITPK